MHKRGLLFLFLVFALVGFLIGRETTYTGRQISTVGNITVNIVSGIACTISNAATSISFGTNLSVNMTYNATQNFNGLDNATFYNITNHAASTATINISINGADFIFGSNRVGISNVSWTSNTTLGNGTNMLYPGIANVSTNIDETNRIAVAEPIGSTVWYRLWLRIPSGTVAGNYTGNYTIRCEET